MWNRIISLGLFELISLFIYRADSTNTSVITTQKGHVYVPLLKHGVDVRGADFVIFYVKACTDVHVGMASEESNFQSKMYVVIIGSWYNSVSSINEFNQAGTSTKLSEKKGSYLKCDIYRKFNISWSGGMMRVLVSDSLIMQGEIGKFPINYLGISTWNNYMGDWIFEIPESLVATSSWLSTSDDLQISYDSVTSPDRYIQMTSSDETLLTFSDSMSSPYQMTSSEDLHTSVESISSLDTTMSSEGRQSSFNPASSSSLQMTMTSSEGPHTSFESISSLDTTMSLEDQQASFNPASSVYQMTSSETLQTTIDTISSNDSTTSSEGTKTMQTEYLPEGGNNCKCFCEILFKPKQSVNEHIKEIQKKLFVSRHNLSATMRRYISVLDNRPSAVSLGVTSIACLVCAVLVIILPDFLSLILYMKNKFGI